jgi:hypothetical protein
LGCSRIWMSFQENKSLIHQYLSINEQANIQIDKTLSDRNTAKYGKPCIVPYPWSSGGQRVAFLGCRFSLVCHILSRIWIVHHK